MAGLKKIGIILGLIGVVLTCVRLIPVFMVFGKYLGLDYSLGQQVSPEYALASYLFFLAIVGWICGLLGMIILMFTDRNASIALVLGAAAFIGIYLYARFIDFNTPDVNVYDFLFFNIGPLHTGIPPIIEPILYLLAALLCHLGIRKERK